MTIDFVKWGSTEQFRHVVKAVNRKAEYVTTLEDGSVVVNEQAAKPVIEFIGTVKLDGTNGGVAVNLRTGEVKAQSRGQFLREGNTNFGFYGFVQERSQFFRDLAESASINTPKEPDIIRFYGEWVGQGIQGRTAISRMDKMFVIFAMSVEVEGHEPIVLPFNIVEGMINLSHLIFQREGAAIGVHMITDFPVWRGEIDFNKPHEAQEMLAKLAADVVAECPVSKALGLEPDALGRLPGEGMVFTAYEIADLSFKVVGEDFKATKSVSKVPSIDPEVFAGINAFADAAMTQSRLEQGWNALQQEIGELDSQHTGAFIRWCCADVVKEEADTMEANNFDQKSVLKRVSSIAAAYFKARLDA